MFGFGTKISNVTPQEAQQLVSEGAQFIDVRSRGEFKGGHPKGAKNVPLAALEAQMKNLDQAIDVVCICAMGPRSSSATKALTKAGFKAHNVKGGGMAWQRAGLPWQK